MCPRRQKYNNSMYCRLQNLFPSPFYWFLFWICLISGCLFAVYAGQLSLPHWPLQVEKKSCCWNFNYFFFFFFSWLQGWAGLKRCVLYANTLQRRRQTTDLLHFFFKVKNKHYSANPINLLWWKIDQKDRKSLQV